jgi:Domain of unknown function (DUF4304)
MSNLPRLEVAIKEHFAPALRKDGFTGSGRIFRRVHGEFVQIIGVQGSRHGGQFAINLALHPLSIPDVLGNMPDSKKMTDALCEFRRRLASNGTDQWWSHENTIESMSQAITEAAEVYMSVGRPLLNQLGGEHSPLNDITAQVLEDQPSALQGFASTKVRTALVLARMRQASGNKAAAIEFAKLGLASVGSAVSLRRELESICTQA